jgi:hypothetical protein
MKAICLNSRNKPSRTIRLAGVLALLPALSFTAQVQATSFPIASNGVVMSWAFDGSNFLVGVESPLTAPAPIAAQMLATNGSKVGPPISTGRTGIATALAFDGTNYLLIWEDDELGALTNASYQIYGQFISKAGTPVGAPFNISGLGVQFDGIKTLAFGGGTYLATYTRLIDPNQGDHSTNRYIAGKLVSPNGSLGSEFRISTGYGKASDVASDGNNFFVVWCEDLADTEIRGRFVSPAGVPGAEISVNASLSPSDNPVTVVFGDTNYLVVWNDEVGGAGTYTWDAFAQLVSPSGALVGDVIPLVTEPGPQLAISAAFDGRHYLVTWVDMQNPTNWDAYGQFINRSGSLFGDRWTISADPKNQFAGVGFAAGRYVVVVNSGVVMGEGGFTEADSASGMFLAPPDDPHILTVDPSFGVRTNRFGFTIAGYSNVVVVVDACTNLNQPVWAALKTNTLAGGSAYFSDPDWTNYRGRFYRLRLP